MANLESGQQSILRLLSDDILPRLTGVEKHTWQRRAATAGKYTGVVAIAGALAQLAAARWPEVAQALHGVGEVFSGLLPQ